MHANPEGAKAQWRNKSTGSREIYSSTHWQEAEDAVRIAPRCRIPRLGADRVKALITGSRGLVGTACMELFGRENFEVFGLDNGGRAQFFPDSGAPRCGNFGTSVTDREAVDRMMDAIRPDLIIHCAAQPSHDLAARIPFLDFETNALGTLNLLEAARRHCPQAPFVFLSTNKVYGDRPNQVTMKETATRYEMVSHEGIDEGFSIDQSTHSLFGVSKLAADILVQEYGRYFGMRTVCLRAGCLTGPQHAGVELHGFLSYLIKCNIEQREYKVFGYKGKQVRDNLHADDVARFALEFFRAPRVAAIYNIGGGKPNSCSILEAFALAEKYSGVKMKWAYVDQPRTGDHICYYSDLSKIKADYPGWTVTRPLASIIEEMVEVRMRA